jgi:hypothetical protein
MKLIDRNSNSAIIWKLKLPDIIAPSFLHFARPSDQAIWQDFPRTNRVMWSTFWEFSSLWYGRSLSCQRSVDNRDKLKTELAENMSLHSKQIRVRSNPAIEWIKDPVTKTSILKDGTPKNPIRSTSWPDVWNSPKRWTQTGDRGERNCDWQTSPYVERNQLEDVM